MSHPPYWLPWLRKLVEEAEQAAQRRAAARTPREAAAADAELDAALQALQRYYCRLPNQLPFDSGLLERMARLAALWLARVPASR